MQGKRLIHRLGLKNLLSFGPETEPIELQPLNVIIGPNASGKSNLIEVIGLLRALPRDLAGAVRETGGVGEWLFKGVQPPLPAEIEAIIESHPGAMPLQYHLSFAAANQRMDVIGEILQDERRAHANHPDAIGLFPLYQFAGAQSLIRARRLNAKSDPLLDDRELRPIRREDLKRDQSIFAQRVDRDQYPEITEINELFRSIFIFHGQNFGRFARSRQPQATDLPEDFLLEDAGNLGIVLNDLFHKGLKPRLLELLKTYSESYDDMTLRISGGSAQLYLHEHDLSSPTPARRLSDGTLHFLCLLAILCHPSPPPLICLEEPEIGHHPDIIRTIAGLLVEASERTQLIVTTHSDHLVSALSSTPEAVIVCEKPDQSTVLRRLDAQTLEKWLDDYALGQIWLSGEIGGTRW